MRSIRYGLICLILFSASTARADLVINLSFNNTSAPADGSPIFGGGTRAQAQGVVQTAANYWESAFANSNSSASWAAAGRITQSISVSWISQSGSTLATGGTGWNGAGALTGGVLQFDNDGSSLFYVDPNPANNTEWNQSSTRSLPFNGVSMNAERVNFDAPAGVIRSNVDMLSVAIHEIGHAIGFLGPYPGFAANVSGPNFNVTGGPFNGAAVPVSGGHTNFQILSPNTTFPYNPGGGGFFNQFNYGPNVMGPSGVAGVRYRLTEVDIALMAETLGFDPTTVNYNPTVVPEPGSLLLISFASLALIANRRRRV